MSFSRFLSFDSFYFINNSEDNYARKSDLFLKITYGIWIGMMLLGLILLTCYDRLK
jgi:tetrahydromethanopterin S-methyltransferase subunit B